MIIKIQLRKVKLFILDQDLIWDKNNTIDKLIDQYRILLSSSRLELEKYDKINNQVRNNNLDKQIKEKLKFTTRIIERY